MKLYNSNYVICWYSKFQNKPFYQGEFGVTFDLNKARKFENKLIASYNFYKGNVIGYNSPKILTINTAIKNLNKINIRSKCENCGIVFDNVNKKSICFCSKKCSEFFEKTGEKYVIRLNSDPKDEKYILYQINGVNYYGITEDIRDAKVFNSKRMAKKFIERYSPINCAFTNIVSHKSEVELNNSIKKQIDNQYTIYGKCIKCENCKKFCKNELLPIQDLTSKYRFCSKNCLELFYEKLGYETH